MTRKFRPTVQAITALNAQLTVDISSLLSDAKGLDIDSAIRGTLGALYTNICDLMSPRQADQISDTRLLNAWHSFIPPIESLAKLPKNGHFLAIRFHLYLLQAFAAENNLTRDFFGPASSQSITARGAFFFRMDELLLPHLCKIWHTSDKREMFRWALSEHPVGHSSQQPLDISPRKLEWACALSPEELAAKGGSRGAWRWEHKEGHPRITVEDFRAEFLDVRSWSCESVPGGSSPLILAADIGSRGPIHESYFFRVSVKNRSSHSIAARHRYMVPRCKQFLFDVTRVAQSNLEQDGRRTAQLFLRKSRLPLELEEMVLAYVGAPPKLPYLDMLDLAAVYRPFPEIKKCDDCADHGVDAATDTKLKAKINLERKKTCSSKALVLWNAPLRAFMAFHKHTRPGQLQADWIACRHSDCLGHHSDPESWMVTQDADVSEWFEDIVRGRCGMGTTLTDIGLGPVDITEAEVYDNYNSQPQQDPFFFKEPRWIEDVRLDARDSKARIRQSGLGGLVDTILHHKRRVAFFKPLHITGRPRTIWDDGLWENGGGNSPWVFGRSRKEEIIVEQLMGKQHHNEVSRRHNFDCHY